MRFKHDMLWEYLTFLIWKGKRKGTRQKYLSLNGEEQDTFLILHMRFVKDHNTGLNLTHVEYFLGLSTHCCRAVFKIAHSIGKYEAPERPTMTSNGITFRQECIWI